MNINNHKYIQGHQAEADFRSTARLRDEYKMVGNKE
jgi:hypothetical protein